MTFFAFLLLLGFIPLIYCQSSWNLVEGPTPAIQDKCCGDRFGNLADNIPFLAISGEWAAVGFMLHNFAPTRPGYIALYHKRLNQHGILSWEAHSNLTRPFGTYYYTFTRLHEQK